MTLDGALFGVGLEHALARNWTVKFEYDYIAYGSKAVDHHRLQYIWWRQQLLLQRFDSDELEQAALKFGVNYLFNPLGPVAKF